MSYIELKDVKKIYKMGEVNINALSGVNFSVEKGEFVIIAGASEPYRKGKYRNGNTDL